MRFFNTAGPIKIEDHYCLPPLERFDKEQLLSLIDQKKYFILHAPRQTGKTSCMLTLMDYINKEKKYKCLYINIESAQGAREDVKRGIKAILNEISTSSRIYLNDTFPKSIWNDILENSGEDAALNETLTFWSEQSDKPIILLIDEIDALIGDTLISVLRQLRSGYTKRPKMFPQSIILCGLRDIRDYRIHSSKTKEIITGGSAFNIKAKSLKLGDFTEKEVRTLYELHTAETGQKFEEEVFDLVWKYTQGQPWLVNALAYEATFDMKENQDRTIPITADMIKQARENIILRRETHIDQLVDKLREDRVCRVIQPILAGLDNPELISTDDLQYVEDLGLIKRKGSIRIANDIYKEVIPRELTYSTQVTITHESEWYTDENGFLDMNKLMSAFQEFFRRHSEAWIERFDYKEAGPQLLLQAFLQRIVNGGSRVEREYGLGTLRTDLLVVWKHKTGVQNFVIELKIRYESLDKTINDGLEQTWKYMDKCGAEEGHLVIFDRNKNKTWEEKIFCREQDYKGGLINIWGM